jgi:hypothetical protein
MATNQEIINNAYFAASHRNKWTSSVETREGFNSGFYAGAQWAMRTSAQLSPHIAKFCELIVWLTSPDLPSDDAA